MAVTVLSPTLRVSPRVAKWTLSEVGADEPFEVGHNNPYLTLYAYCTSGSVTLKFQISPDGTTWIDLPDSTFTLNEGDATVKTLTASVHSIRPVVTSGTTFSAVAYVIAVRP